MSWVSDHAPVYAEHEPAVEEDSIRGHQDARAAPHPPSPRVGHTTDTGAVFLFHTSETLFLYSRVDGIFLIHDDAFLFPTLNINGSRIKDARFVTCYPYKWSQSLLCVKYTILNELPLKKESQNFLTKNVF